MSQRNAAQLLIAILRCFLKKELYEEELSAEELEPLYALANKHDIAHIVNEVLNNSAAPFVQAKRLAVYRYMQQDYNRQCIYKLFEEKQIPYVPLKGSVINTLYPEAWQRTSCDIDILVREDDLDKAQEALEKDLAFRTQEKSAHDISLLSPDGVHLELHYNFDEAEIVLNEVWCSVKPMGEYAMQYAMSSELFMLHHISHMAKHFKNGGCGLRPFLDLWFISRKTDCDSGKLNELMKERRLEPFADAVFALLDFWFDEGEGGPLVSAMANYILPAGVYGSIQNHVAVGQLRKGNKVNYFTARMFLPREALEYPYPALKKHGWLLPFCQLHRWYSLLAKRKLKRITVELNANHTMDSAYRNDVGKMLKELGL